MYKSTIIAEKIKNLSRIKKIHIGDMLSDCKLSKNAISSMLHGSMPKVDNLAKIADYLECSLDYLLGRTDIPENPYLNLSNENNVPERMNQETECAVKLNTSLSDIENRVNRKLQDIKNSDGLDKNKAD